MDLATLTAFFGWMTLINAVMLTLSALLLLGMRDVVIGLHERFLAMPEADLNALYANWLGAYKVGFLLLNFVPWLALRIVG